MKKVKLPNYQTGLVQFGQIRLDDKSPSIAVFTSERSYGIGRRQRRLTNLMTYEEFRSLDLPVEFVKRQWYELKGDEKYGGEIMLPDGRKGMLKF